MGTEVKRNCAAIGCQHQVLQHRLMCLQHWKLVPLATKTRIKKYYRSSARLYAEAINDAVQAVNERECQTVFGVDYAAD